MRILLSIFSRCISALVTVLALLLMSGCSDSDVTSSSRYNFSSFSGTEWKTKAKIAVAKIKQGGPAEIYLIALESFDANHPQYRPIAGCTVISVLPVGSRIRIEHLMKNNVDWGGVRVTATVKDSPVPQKTIYVEEALLAKNRFLYDAMTSPSTNWGVNPDIFDKL